MVLTAYSALSPVTGLCCHRRPCDAQHHHELDASVGASGPHGFAVRDSITRLLMPQRPPHSAPNVRDDAYVPLTGADSERHSGDFSCEESEKFFVLALDTDLPDGRHAIIGWASELQLVHQYS